jgi:hypothetical protein
VRRERPAAGRGRAASATRFPADEAQANNRAGAELRRVDAEAPQRGQRVPAEKAAADDILRTRRPLDQLGGRNRARQPNGRR